MYSCCSGTCFLKPASTCSCEAKYSITAVTAANSASTTGRLPKTSFSAKRANGPGSTLGRVIGAPSLRVVHVGALVADHEEGGIADRDDACQQRRLAGGGRERLRHERVGRGRSRQHRAVGAD